MIFKFPFWVIPVSVPDTVIDCIVFVVFLLLLDLELSLSVLEFGSWPKGSDSDPESDSDPDSDSDSGSCKLDAGEIVGFPAESKIINQWIDKWYYFSKS